MRTNIALIPAREGSKGVPGKNTKYLMGKPLICYSIEVALESNSIDYVVVTSDSKKILDLAGSYGDRIITIDRPKVLASDRSTTEDTMSHAIGVLKENKIDVEYSILLQPTSPIRKKEFIEDALKKMHISGADSLISVSEPIQHPSDFIILEGDNFKYLYRTGLESRRQDFKKSFFINGSIYITKLSYFERTRNLYSIDDCAVMVLPKEYSIDIDTEFDFFLAEAAIKAIGKNELQNRN